MLISAIIAFFSAAGIYFIFRCIKQALLKQINASDNLNVGTLISVSGEARELEMLVRKLKSREDSGEIYLRCRDTDSQTLQIAEKLARRGLVKIIN